MKERRPPKDEVLAEASAWLARLHADDRSPNDEKLFSAWLSANPEHADAFEAADRSWTVLGGVSRKAPSRPTKAFNRRRLLASGLGIAVVGAGSLSFIHSSSAKTYETGVGEQKRVSLEDGSRIFLNAQTRLTVLFDQSTRIADLEYGRANFDVAIDEHRPFIVKAAQRRVVGQKCAFDVRREGNDIQIVLIKGTAKIFANEPAHRSSDTADGQVLRSGDRLVSAAGHYRLDHPNLTPLVAWQAGRAIFENDPLVEAVREMNLYSAEKLEVADAAAAQLRVSGVYHVGDNAGFARSVSKLLPVSVYKQGDHLVLSAASVTR